MKISNNYDSSLTSLLWRGNKTIFNCEIPSIGLRSGYFQTAIIILFILMFYCLFSLLRKTFSRQHFKIFFSYFSQKIGSAVSTGDNLHESKKI